MAAWLGLIVIACLGVGFQPVAEAGAEQQQQKTTLRIDGEIEPAAFDQACVLLSHEDPRVVRNAINHLLRHTYRAEVGPALNEPAFDQLVSALVEAIDTPPDDQGEPLHINDRLTAAQWLFRKFDMHLRDRHHRRIETPTGWPHLKDAQKRGFVEDVVDWCKERAALKLRGELPEDARPHDSGVTITGRVLDKPGGAGAQGVRVTLIASSDHSRRHATTDARGRYTFPAVPAIGTSHKLRVGENGPGVATEGTYLHVAVPEERLGLTQMQAERDLYASHPYTLRGVVTDAQSGQGIPGVAVRARTRDRNHISVETDHHGRYRVHTVSDQVRVECDASLNRRYYSPPAEPEEGEDPGEANLRRRTVQLDPGQAVEGIDFKLYPAPAYSLRFFMPDGSAASGMEVYVLQMYTRLEPLLDDGFTRSFASMGHHDYLTTDPDGRIAGYLRSAYGRHQRAAIELSVIARTEDLKLGVTRKIKLTTDDPPPDALTITLEPCSTAELRVVDPEGQPIKQAMLWTRPMYQHHVFGYPHASPKINALGDGRFHIEGMIPGWTYRTEGRAEGYKTRKAIELSNDGGKHEDVGNLVMDFWDQRAVPGLLQQLQHADADEREQACQHLAELGTDAAGAVPALIEVLKNDPKSTVRYPAANALGRIGAAAVPAVPQLIHALEHDEHGVPREAANALGKLAGPEAIPALTAALRHEDMDTRHAAIDAMVRIAASDAIAALAEILRDPEMHGRTKIHAVKALETIGSTHALPVLRETLKSRNRALKDAAEKAIRAIEFLNQAMSLRPRA